MAISDKTANLLFFLAFGCVVYIVLIVFLVMMLQHGLPSSGLTARPAYL